MISSKSKVRTATRLTGGAVLFASSLAVSGCVGMAPTYGTGKHADQQLMEDVSTMFSLKPQRGEQIDYKPRPDLVKPAEGAAAGALPAPQDNIVTASANSGQWPESPEQRRARIRKTATENQDNINFEPEVAVSSTDRPSRGGTVRATRGDDVNLDGSSVSTQKQREDFNRRLAQSQQGSPTNRRYLSEPPLEYRQPADTAAQNDVGEDEWKKDRRRKAGYKKKEKGGWWPW